MASFSLLDQPWIPVRRPGEPLPREVGIREALLHAAEYVEIADPSPVSTVALHRLLLTVLHRVFGPEDIGAWVALWREGRFPVGRLDAYLDCWAARFDLFDPAHPFGQDEHAPPDKWRPAVDLVMELSGSNAGHFSHALEDGSMALSPAQAARAMLGWQLFSPGGTIGGDTGLDYSTTAPLQPTAVALVRGGTLFQTLMLNLHRYSPGDKEPFECSGEDLPAWERDASAGRTDRIPTGYLDLLTWQTRRIRLWPEEQGDTTVVCWVTLLRGCQFPAGYMLHGREPMVAYRELAKPKPGQEPWVPLRFQQDRAIWRDSHTLLATRGGSTERPKSLSWLADVARESDVLQRRSIRPLDLFGLGGNKARIDFWRHERLPVPLAYLDDDALRARLERAIAAAENVRRALSFAAQITAKLVLAPESGHGGREPDKKVVRQLAESLDAVRPYWAALEGPFRAFLVDQAAARTVEDEEGEIDYDRAPFDRWLGVVRDTAWQAFRMATNDLDTSARALRAMTAGERALGGGLREVLSEFIAQKGDIYDQPAS